MHQSTYPNCILEDASHCLAVVSHSDTDIQFRNPLALSSTIETNRRQHNCLRPQGEKPQVLFLLVTGEMQAALAPGFAF